MIAGILAIGCAFALGWAAFGSPLGGLVLAALVAVSPYHVHFSRQAREYELFSTFAFGGSALLLWALGRSGPLRWAAYALSAALGLYTDPLFAGVIAAQAITVAATQRRRETLVAFACSCLAALAAFAPWGAVLFGERRSAHAQLDWLSGTYPFVFLAKKWLFNLGTIGFDAELRDLRLGVLVAAFAALLLIATGRAVRAAFAARPEAAAVLGLALAAIPILVFGAYDVVERAHYTTVARYFAESAVGLDVLLAGWLMACLQSRPNVRAVGLIAFTLVSLAGIGSDVASAGTVNWWDNNYPINYRSVAETLNRSTGPVVAVSDAAAALVLTHYLAPQARFLLVADAGASARRLASVRGPIFLIAPSEQLKAAVVGTGLALANVSPPNLSPMAEFRAGLERERPDARAALGPGSAANAVWSVRREATGAPASK